MEINLTPSELVQLGSRFGISVNSADAEILCQDVIDNIQNLEDPYLTPTLPPTATENRSWQPPQKDPYNAIAISCIVPPSHQGTLSNLKVGVKDAISVAGIPMRAGSEIFSNFIPTSDATLVTRLLSSGATITVKTTLDELAASPRSTTSVDGPILNPHDPNRVAGGSSGGSAIATATGIVDIAIGTDTGGSVRGPASFCGILGIKPTYGLISLNGVVENTYTLDHVGIFSKTVENMALCLDAIAGKDEKDPASMQAAGKDDYKFGGYMESLQNQPPVDQITFGLLEEGFGEGVNTKIESKTRETIDNLSNAGASIKSISIPKLAEHKALKDHISYAETAVHWRARGAPYRKGGSSDPFYQSTFTHRAQEKDFKLGRYYKSKLLTGCYLLDENNGQSYTHSQAARSQFTTNFENSMIDVDVLITPTMVGLPPRVEDASNPGFDTGRNTRIANLTGLPAISIPNGKIDGLCIGIQLIGKSFDEAKLLCYANTVQNFTSK